jgi:siroheme synthase-like protein
MIPLFVKLEGRRVVVIGAGSAAERKIADLASAGARVEVIAPEVTDAIRAMSVTVHRREYARGDLEGAWLAVSATGDPKVARAIRDEAESARVWLLALDDRETTCIYSASVIRREPLVVAIGSNGEAPALVRLMREVLEKALPEASWVEAARRLRRKWKSDGTPHASRFAELVGTLGTPRSP